MQDLSTPISEIKGPEKKNNTLYILNGKYKREISVLTFFCLSEFGFFR